MTQKILALGLAVSTILLAVQPMFGQSQPSQNCAPHASMVAQLVEKYGETRQSIGLTSGNQLVELFASSETGSWSIIVTRPTGMTCILAAGQAFERVGGVRGPARPGAPA